jgi:hypothetical protein
MKLHLNSTANLGDFLNALPVLSGIYKSTGEKVYLIIRKEMRKFKGIIELLMYQGIFEDVVFDDEVFISGVIELSSWTREDKNDDFRPIETCRYENWLKDNYGMEFDVDDDFILQVPELNMPFDDEYYCGDRWSGPDIDTRRSSNTLSKIGNVRYLDYDDDIIENAYIIKHCKPPFISTFTGISGIADLLNKDQVVLWSDELRNWDNKPIEYSFEKHYYGNRKSKLMYIGDFSVEALI